MPHAVDLHVGKVIRQRRGEIGMTQQQLGEAVGTRFQQIQKYETGANRVSASRLWEIAIALKVPVAFFFPLPNGPADHPSLPPVERCDACSQPVDTHLAETFATE